MAGTMTFVYDDGYDKDGRPGSVRRIICSWTSTSGGAADATTKKISGFLLKGVTNPTDSPTDDYDITLTDDDGADLLSASFANLTNRDVTNTETRFFNLTDGTVPIADYPAVCSPITVTVSAAGSTKSGVLTLYYRVC